STADSSAIRRPSLRMGVYFHVNPRICFQRPVPGEIYTLVPHQRGPLEGPCLSGMVANRPTPSMDRLRKSRNPGTSDHVSCPILDMRWLGERGYLGRFCCQHEF